MGGSGAQLTWWNFWTQREKVTYGDAHAVLELIMQSALPIERGNRLIMRRKGGSQHRALLSSQVFRRGGWEAPKREKRTVPGKI